MKTKLFLLLATISLSASIIAAEEETNVKRDKDLNGDNCDIVRIQNSSDVHYEITRENKSSIFVYVNQKQEGIKNPTLIRNIVQSGINEERLSLQYKAYNGEERISAFKYHHLYPSSSVTAECEISRARFIK